MNLMLAVLMAAVGVGLLAPHFDRRIYLLMALLSVIMTCLYFFTTRFM